MPLGEDVVIVPVVPLGRTHVADTAVAMIVLVPVNEPARPCSCSLEIDEPFRRELGAVLRGAKQSLDERVAGCLNGVWSGSAPKQMRVILLAKAQTALRAK